MSCAVYAIKLELDNGRHFHALIKVNMVRFNQNDLIPLIRISLYLRFEKAFVHSNEISLDHR